MEMYAITGLGALCLFLAGTLVKVLLVRRSEKSEDAKAKDKERAARWEKLNLRLESGVGAMQALTRKVDRLEDKVNRTEDKVTATQEQVTRVADDVVRAPDFDRYCQAHDEVHEGLKRDMGRLADGQTEIATDVKGMGEHMRGVREAMSDLASKLVIGREPA